MKIIQTDNYDRDDVSEQLIAENVSEHWSKTIVTLLNDRFSGNDSSFFARVVSDDHKLYKWEP